MNRSTFAFAILIALACRLILVGAEKYSLTIDARQQLAPPARGRGPFPRSIIPGYTPDLPLRIGLNFPTGEIGSDGNVLIDFVVTNVGSRAIRLPASIQQPMTDVLTLFFTADEDAVGISLFGKKPNVASNGLMGLYGTSAELYGRSDDPQSYYLLAPNQSILVHASSRLRLRPGLHSFVAHAELLGIAGGTSRLIGTVDSGTVRQRLQAP